MGGICAASQKHPNSAKRKPGALAGATGVTLHEKVGINSRRNGTAKPRFNAMSKYAKRAHKAAARMLGYALTLGDEAAWHSMTIVLMAKLTDRERAALAYAALNSLDEDTAHMTASVVLFGILDGEALA
jgi:hypothetical protein